MDTRQEFYELEKRLYQQITSYHIELRSEILREVDEKLERFKDRILTEAAKRNKTSAFVQRGGHDGRPTEAELREHYSQDVSNEPTEEATQFLNDHFPHLPSPWEKEPGVVHQPSDVSEIRKGGNEENNQATFAVSDMEKLLEKTIASVLRNMAVVEESKAVETTVVPPEEEQELYYYSWANYDPSVYQRRASDLGDFR